MGEEHDGLNAEAGPNQPPFLSGVKGIVAGITSAMVAITALLAAVTNLFGNHGSPPARAATEALADVPATPLPVAASAVAADEGAPTHYTGTNSDGQGIEVNWDGKQWIYTDPQKSYVYVDLTSADKDMVLAYDREIDGYLRWPIQGGAVEESSKNQLEFKPIGMLRTSEGN